MRDTELLDQNKVKAVKEAEKEAERVKKDNVSDMRQLLKQLPFRRYAWKLLSETGVFRASFNPDALQMAFNEGRKDIGLGLLQEINEADINVFARMQAEHVLETKSKKSEQEKQNE